MFVRGQREGAAQGASGQVDMEALRTHLRHQMIGDLARGVNKTAADLCLDRCLGSSFDDGMSQKSQRCLTLCAERVMEAYVIVERKFDEVAALQQQGMQ
jgi:hypothetical protein